MLAKTDLKSVWVGMETSCRTLSRMELESVYQCKMEVVKRCCLSMVVSILQHRSLEGQTHDNGTELSCRE